jgi:putative transposase
MPQGHAYLCAVMDWHTRYVLGWAVSNTMDAALTREALENAVKNCQKLPEIFNTDHGSQFTSPEWVGKLEGLGIKVSMDGKGRWMDNVFIERLWRTLKYEDVYLKEYGTLCDLRRGLREWFTRYNAWRTHQALGNRTPEKAYREDRKEKKEAA